MVRHVTVIGPTETLDHTGVSCFAAGKGKSIFGRGKSLSNELLSRFDVSRGRALDDESPVRPVRLLQMKSQSSSEETHVRLDSEHALLRAIAQDGLALLLTLLANRRLIFKRAAVFELHIPAIVFADHSAISGLHKRFPDHKVNWRKKVGGLLGKIRNSDIFYYRVADYDLEWQLGDTAARMSHTHTHTLFTYI